MKGIAPTLLPELVVSLLRPFRSRASMERYQTNALRRLAAHAYERVSFYRRHFDRHGIRPSDLRALTDWSRLPSVTRSELQSLPLADRMSPGIDPATCHAYDTSGSTGQPLRILRTPHEDARLFGRRLRAQVLSGLRPWDLRVNIGSPRRIFGWHRLGAFRIRTVSDRQSLEGLVDRVAALRPDVLTVPPESLALLIEQAAAGGRRPTPRRVFTGANQLAAGLRRRAEKELRTSITDFYGTSECNLVAWECERCGLYHTSDDSVVVELLREDGCPAGPGEAGEVVITALHSYAMPFVRFRLGDVARRPREPRRCAIRFGALESIEGRVIDHIRTPGGAVIGPFRILDVIDDLAGIRRWQMVQVEPGRVEVRFEPAPGAASEDVARAIAGACHALFPSDVEIEPRATRFEDDEAGGAKLRFVRAFH
jgi:phenylacetate-CoA ligase